MVVVSSLDSGHEAHSEAQATSAIDSMSLHAVSVPESSPSVVATRVFRPPGFPSLGAGRAVRISVDAGVMAGLGGPPPAAGSGHGAPPPARQGPPLTASGPQC